MVCQEQSHSQGLGADAVRQGHEKKGKENICKIQ